MKRNPRLLLVTLFVLTIFIGCSSLGNPFVGKWVSGAFNLELKSDKTFELAIGKTVSVNLEGTYDYDKDKETLTLNIENENKVTFSYEFKDDADTLVLNPDGDFSYISTEIEFTRE